MLRQPSQRFSNRFAVKEKEPAREISIALLPFENLSGRDELDLFCKSFYHDVLTAFSRFRQFRVVPADTSSREGAEYLFRGTFRSNDAGHLRLNAQLLNQVEGVVTWADWHELADDGISSVQETLLRQVIAALQSHVNHDIVRQTRKKTPSSLSAYEHWLTGMEELKKASLAADEKARHHFQRAIALDPNYALAYSGMSLTYFNEWSCQLWERWDASQKGAFDWAKKAIELDEQNYIASLVLGRIYLYEGRYEVGEHYLRKALRLNPNDADCMMQVATGFVFLGLLEEARSLFESLPDVGLAKDKFAHIGAFIALEQGHFTDSLALGAGVRSSWIDFPAMMAAAYFEINDIEAMNHCWTTFINELKLKILKDEPLIDNAQAVQWLVNVNPYKGSSQQQRFWDFISNKRIPSERNIMRVAQPPDQNLFVRENDLWHIRFGGVSVRLRDAKGLRDLAQLLSSPSTPVHCTALGQLETSSRGFPVFDDTARKNYKKRILELQHDIQLAEAQNDQSNYVQLQEEYEKVISHLKASVGLRGKTRRTGDPVEKVRSAVTLRIRGAIQKIKASHPELGRHFHLAVRTGTFCLYEPETETSWTIEP